MKECSDECQRIDGVRDTLETACTHTCFRPTGPLLTDRGLNSCVPYPRPLRIRIKRARGPTNAGAGRIYSAAEKVDTHKVRDDRYSTNCLEAIYLSFVLGLSTKFQG